MPADGIGDDQDGRGENELELNLLPRLLRIRRQAFQPHPNRMPAFHAAQVKDESSNCKASKWRRRSSCCPPAQPCRRAHRPKRLIWTVALLVLKYRFVTLSEKLMMLGSIAIVDNRVKSVLPLEASRFVSDKSVVPKYHQNHQQRRCVPIGSHACPVLGLHEQSSAGPTSAP